MTTDDVKAIELYDELAAQGFTDAEIAEAMCDGKFLGEIGVSQTVAELVYERTKGEKE